jgi:D-alanyl-lipoteichoic acid acyltransferase DltB (MBOAT superfamily)
VQFNSITFFIFFALVLSVHYSPLSWRTKKVSLLLASYLFYAAWNPPFVVLLWLSTGIDWVVARRLHHTRSRKARRGLLLVSLLANLGLLGLFKYGGFLMESFTALMSLTGARFSPPGLDIVLPIGISFYTFQTLSYTLDVYRGTSEPWSSFLDFALYVTFFPQLVAGPIVRSGTFLPQCASERKATSSSFAWGFALLTIGMFEKNVVADALLAPIADRVFSSDLTGFVATWTGTLAFSGQIFCDFAGYSTCAIGVALCLGFRLPDNFRFPYAAIGFSDFWQRWHISLSTWLRDYLYIPLGGNRHGPIRTMVNLMITMLLGGLWHGASWTFVFWGGLHGLYLMIERELRARFSRLNIWSGPRVRIALALATYVAVSFTWVFFRAGSFERAFAISGGMLGLHGSGSVGELPGVDILVVMGVTMAILAVHWLMRDRSLESAANGAPLAIRAVALAAMMVAIVTTPGQDRAFIYFQF